MCSVGSVASMEYPALIVGLLMGPWLAQGAVLLGPGHLALTSWRFDGDAVRRRCLEKSITNVTCAGVSEDRLLPHPDDCELFYYCVGRVAICRQCPAGLHFSPTTHVCDRTEDAGCSPPANITEESSSSAHTASEETSTFITSTSSAPTNKPTYFTTLLTSTPTDNTSSTTPSEVANITVTPRESTTRDSMTTYIKLH